MRARGIHPIEQAMRDREVRARETYRLRGMGRGGGREWIGAYVGVFGGREREMGMEMEMEVLPRYEERRNGSGGEGSSGGGGVDVAVPPPAYEFGRAGERSGYEGRRYFGGI